ncbi:MAG: outer membrane protein [Bacteroidetes bacterium]|jgi:outer membrane protein|nr:outer membrane protein [Bacteroidota bacterium]
MKKIIGTLFVIATLGIGTLQAQKFGYVDSDFILNSIPEYKAAKTELDKLSNDWQKEIELKYAEIDKLYKAYQAEQILLTDEMKKKRENEIVSKEAEAKELQKAKFGVDGELFKKRMELIKPIQDKVYNAVKAVADKNGMAVIFDKNSDITILYSNPKFDKSQAVLDYMGYNKKK